MADDEWSYRVSVAGVPEASAEEWLRATWEEGPGFLRVLLPIAWRYGLGLHLGSTGDPTRILGWRVGDSAPDRVSVDATSRVLSAANVVTVAGSDLQWRTLVTYRNVFGRLLWTPARLIHRVLVPWAVRSAIARRSGSATETG